MLDERFADFTVTRQSRDGSGDVIANHRGGHALHHVRLEAYVEVKRWNPASPVEARPMMRLLSQVKHRDMEVFITTSFLDGQVQREPIEDGHLVLLIPGGDITGLLRQRELGEDPALGAGWSESGSAPEAWRR